MLSQSLLRLAAGVILLALVAIFPLAGAPAPLKPAKAVLRLPLVGSWRLSWCGGTGEVVFREKGGYACEWCGQDWIGHWSVSDGILTVTEAVQPSQANPPPSWFTWKVSLAPGGLSGKLPGGGDFTLEPLAKKE